jgi:hypothetical protein
MQKGNKPHEPFVIILSAVVILLLLSFVNSGVQVGSFESRRVNLLADISSKGKILKAAPAQVKTVPEDIAQTVQTKTGSAPKDIPLDQYPGILEFGNDSSGGLRNFFEALASLGKKKRKVRVAYFGDSMIEGDLITQDFRNLLQEKFGGSGVGFMPVTSIVAGFRQSIIHSFSPNWKEYSLLDAADARHGLGITGHTFIPVAAGEQVDSTATSGGSWVKYTAVNRKRLNAFGHVHLYYGKAEGKNFVSLQNDKSIALNGSAAVNEAVLSSGPVKGFKATFSTQTPLNVYGFSMESDSGVVLDNFSFRGNSGLPLTKMPYSVLSGLNQYLQYDLIILQYGVNVVNDKVKDYAWYEKGMTEVVKHLQNCFPHASILIIGAGDKSTRIDGEYVTDPSLPLVVASQRKVAEKTNAAFWNFFEAMGGEGSMVKWVTGDTVCANKDYTHFNSRGASRVGKLLYNYVISEYNKDHKAE